MLHFFCHCYFGHRREAPLRPHQIYPACSCLLKHSTLRLLRAWFLMLIGFDSGYFLFGWQDLLRAELCRSFFFWYIAIYPGWTLQYKLHVLKVPVPSSPHLQVPNSRVTTAPPHLTQFLLGPTILPREPAYRPTSTQELGNGER